MIRFELLKSIREKGLSQRDFAKIVNQHESKVSRIITGEWNPNTETKIKYSKALGKKVEDIFPA